MSSLFSGHLLMVSKPSDLMFALNATCYFSEQSLVGQRLRVSPYIFESNLGIKHVHWLIGHLDY